MNLPWLCSPVRFKPFFAFFLIVAAQAISAADWSYTFRPGDTLWSVCGEYTKEPGCWQKLGPLNGIAANRRIAPGTRIAIPVAWLKVPPASASVLYTSGSVWMQEDGASEIPAEEGMSLPIGARLYTGEGSATIGFADGSSMVLDANSEIRLDTLSNFELNGMVDSTVRLSKGTLKTRVQKREPRSRFKTITPSAVAAVRGTEYLVSLEEQKADAGSSKTTTRVGVYDGLVEVGADKTSYPVPAKFGIVAKQGETLQPPVKLLPAPVFTNQSDQVQVSTDSSGKQSEPVRVSWQDVSGATRYLLRLLEPTDENEPEKLLASFAVPEPRFDLQGLSTGCYRLSLQAEDKLGLLGLAAIKQLCLNPRPQSPVWKTENTDLQGGQHIELAWKEVPGSAGYKLELSEHPGFDTVYYQTELKSTFFKLEHKQAVYVRIFAIDDQGNLSAPSPVLSWHPAQEEPSFWQILAPIGVFILGLLLV